MVERGILITDFMEQRLDDFLLASSTSREPLVFIDEL